MAGPISLYLVRHAIAAERGDAYPDDAKRPLTVKGKARFRQVAQALVALDVRIDLVLTSPLVRARETAEILADVLPNHPPLVETDGLVPGARHRSLLDDLAAHAQSEGIALVGHEPGIGELAVRLIGARTPFEFRKGGVCRIDVDVLPPTAPGTLVWFAPPKILRRAR